MNGLPVIADALERQRHASRCSIGGAFIHLRLSPQASHDRTVAAKHYHVHIADVELNVLDVRIGAFAILAHLIPALRHGSVVVEEHETRRIQIPLCNEIYIRASDALHN